MIGTYAAVLAVCGASLSIGQAALSLCGVRRWSWLSPAVGLALLLAICWATVRMPGDGVVSAIAALVATVAALLYLRGRVEGLAEAAAIGAPVAIAALLAASLPFLVEGRFGILGTGFNPDMSQHLLATFGLAEGGGGQLLREGYPLGPHAVVVALDKGLGVDLVQGFDGLTVAVAALAPLTALAVFRECPRPRGAACALLVGLPYLVASYFAQGAFKETIQAFLVLAFLIALRESGRAWKDLPLRYVPAALVAIGSVYAYSFPGLVWLLGALLAWIAIERRIDARALLLALVVFLLGALPEVGRMSDFAGFETFDPDGPGLGNLFGQISPFTALGIWPSGDFRLAPGDGAAPAVLFYLGAALATALLAAGLLRCARRRESAILAGAIAVAAVYASARIGGTAYTSAKALEVAAPVLTLAILAPPIAGANGWRLIRPFDGKVARPGIESGRVAPIALLSGLFVALAGVCSLLAFANAPVGPASYSPGLTRLRPQLAEDATLVLAPRQLLASEHGTPYLAWELRGERVCIVAEEEAGGSPPPGVRYVIATDSADGIPEAPYPNLTLRRRVGPYALWERPGRVRGGPSPCPLIAVREARQGPR